MRRRAVPVWLLAALCVVVLSGCRDNGLHDRNLPLQEARYREQPYPTYQAATNTPVPMAGHYWMRSLTVESIPSRLLVQVGNAEGTLLYALRSERAPYSRLYTPVSQDRWAPFARLN